MSLANRLWQKIYWTCALLPLRCRLFYLRARNLLARRSAVSIRGPIVSLTTYGKRFDTVFYTLESIAAGDVLPSRLILWLDEPAAIAGLPAPLKRLRERGLEIRPTGNLGPHKKYYPYLELTDRFAVPLVTADDDVLYPSDWLAGLAAAHAARPDLISCYRAHVMRLENGSIAPYATWRPCTTTRESYLNFSTGVSGAIYPPAFLRALKSRGREFLDCCPRADDIWLHATALRAGFKVRQISLTSMLYPEIPGTQEGALCASNLYQAGNDTQIAMTYSGRDIEVLRASSV